MLVKHHSVVLGSRENEGGSKYWLSPCEADPGRLVAEAPPFSAPDLVRSA